MLRFRDFFAVLLLMFATLAVGCEIDSPDANVPSTDGTTDGDDAVEKKSEIVFDRNVLNVDGDGGDMDIIYRIKNPVEGASLEIKSFEEWVTLKTLSASQIILTIDKNTANQPREALVSVDYAGLERAMFITVKQDKAILNTFKFEVSDITYKSCKIHYQCADDNMPYMANVIDKKFFEYSGIDDETVFVDTEMKNYLRIAAEYNMTLEELMANATPQLIYKGDVTRTFDGMQHGGEYVVYSYGVMFDGNTYNITTPVHHTIVELPMPSMYDVEFTLKAAVSGSGSAMLDVDPGNWTGYYSVQVAPSNSLYYVPPGEPLSVSTIRSLADAFYNSARKYISEGNPVEKFLNSSCYKGARQFPLALSSGQQYMIIVFAVESEEGAIPVMRSIPAVTYLSM